MTFKKGNHPKTEFKKGQKIRLGKHHTKEAKERMREAHKGQPNAMKGKHYSEEIRKRMSESFKGRKKPLNAYSFLKGEKNPNWNNGSSFEPYSVDWTKTLKKSIRERDKYTCRICGKEPATYCHHIDYDKQNSNPENLITLCPSCHSKTNKNREHWEKYFRSFN